MFGWNFNPASHMVILIVTLSLLAIQTTLNTIGAKIMGRVAQFGVYVEILGTFGVAVVLGIHGFHHGLGFLTSTQNVQHATANPLGLNFGGSWIGAALVAVLAPVYIFYGFESAGDISEETRNAGRQVPRAMRFSLIGGGIASFVLTAALLLAMPAGAGTVADTVQQRRHPVHPQRAAELACRRSMLALIVVAFFSCGSAVQGAGSRLAFSYARDGALPGSKWISRGQRAVQDPGQRPVRRRAGHGGVHRARVRLADPRRQDLVHHLPGQHQRAGFAGVVRGQRHLPVVPADGDRLDDRPGPRLGARPGKFTLGRWAWPVSVVAGLYLGLMLVNVVLPTGLGSGRSYFNLDWITLLVMAVVAVVGIIVFVAAHRRPGDRRAHDRHRRARPPAARRPGPSAADPVTPGRRRGLRGGRDAEGGAVTRR